MILIQFILLLGVTGKNFFTPSNPTEEALLALLVYLEEERCKVAPKGKSSRQAIRMSLVPLLLWNNKLRCVVEFLTTAENASGHFEGIETYKRWQMLAHACLANRLPGRAVRVSKSLLGKNFEAAEGQLMKEVEDQIEEESEGEKGGNLRIFRTPKGAYQVHLLLLACRAKLDEHRMNMREHNFNGGVDAAVATGWAEKAMHLASADPDLAALHESSVMAYAGCILEAVTRGHQGNPACSPPREIYDHALSEAEKKLTGVLFDKNSRSINPIAAYLLSLIYVRRDKVEEAVQLLSRKGLQNTNSNVQIFMNSLLAVLYATRKRTTKGFNMLEKMLTQLETQELGVSLEKKFFLHRVQLRFAIFKRGATAVFQRGRHGDHTDLIKALAQSGSRRLASLLSAELCLHFAYAQKFSKARVFAEDAMELDPICPLAHHSMGVVHEGVSEYGLALSKYEDAMAACPQYGPSALASALVWEYQMDDYVWHARDLCEDALKWNLDDYEALLALGRMKEQLRDVEASKALNAMGLKHIGQMPCIPYSEFPVIIWEDDQTFDCFSF